MTILVFHTDEEMNITATTQDVHLHSHPLWVKVALQIDSCLIVCVNLYVMILIASKRYHLRGVCAAFLFALLAAHLGIGIVGLFMFNVNSTLDSTILNHKRVFEWMTLCIYQFFSISTICMIILVTIDRLLAIKKPYLYHELTWRFCVWSIAGFMVFPIVFIVSEINSESHIYNLLLFCKATASIFLGISHHLIYREVRRQVSEIAKTIVGEDTSDSVEKKEQLRRRFLRSTRTCYFIVLSNIIFWLPCGISFVLILHSEDGVLDETTMQVRYAAHVFENLNSLKDPLMYAMLNKDLRCQIKSHIMRIIVQLRPTARS